MGLLDSLRDRLTGNYGDDYDDDYYDDYDEEYDDYDDRPRGSSRPQGSGILGNTSRPEAESVAVYTRSGRPVGTNAGAPTQNTAPKPPAQRPSQSYAAYRNRRDDYEQGFDDNAPSGSYSPARATGSFNASGQLPPYVLRAEGYADVQTVVRRVRTNQPVLLALADTPGAEAQRIIDFCYGLAFGIGGEMVPLEGKAFVVLPAGIQLSQSELDRLSSQVR